MNDVTKIVFDKYATTLSKKVYTSIQRLKNFEPPEGYYLAFSGGKDSIVLKALANLAGVKYDAHYNVTTVDPPELVQFIKQKHPDVHRDITRDRDGNPVTMWNLIPRKLMPPTRIVRYCCSELKEHGGVGRVALTGVRWAESVNRKRNQGTVVFASKSANKEILKIDEKADFYVNSSGGVVMDADNDSTRKIVELCYQKQKTTINPIVDWTDQDVWQFIKECHIPVCELYGEGWHRLGCIGCPMASQHGREREFKRWPKFKKLYLLAFGKMLKRREERGKSWIYTYKNLVDYVEKGWKATPEDVFNWWMEYDVLPGQIDLLEEYEE